MIWGFGKFQEGLIFGSSSTTSSTGLTFGPSLEALGIAKVRWEGVHLTSLNDTHTASHTRLPPKTKSVSKNVPQMALLALDIVFF